MIQVAADTRVYLACQPVDLRKGFDGLSALVATVLRDDPFSGHLFLFRVEGAPPDEEALMAEALRLLRNRKSDW